MKRFRCAVCRLAILLVATALGAQQPPAVGRLDLYDRIVAVIDEDPIFASDIERILALQLIERQPDESEAELHRRILDDLIEQRLQLHEVQLYDAGQVSVEQIEQQLSTLRSRFEDDAGWVDHLRSMGLDEENLRHLLTRQLRVMAYIDERLRPRVFVDLDDIREYYDGTLAQEMARQGAEMPPFEDVREAIRSLLREQRLNEEIETWVAELRQKANIVDYLDAPPRPLPPVVDRIDTDGTDTDGTDTDG